MKLRLTLALACAMVLIGCGRDGRITCDACDIGPSVVTPPTTTTPPTSVPPTNTTVVCTYKIQTTTQTFDYTSRRSAGSLSIVTSAPSCAWKLVRTQSWIDFRVGDAASTAITDVVSGIGSRQDQGFNVALNQTKIRREADIKLVNIETGDLLYPALHITQTGAP